MTALTGRRWVYITGATSGIGLEAAGELARLGDQVILGARNAGKGEQARKHVQKEAPGARVELAIGDLSTKEGCRSQVKDVLGITDRLDVLVLNAGLSHPRRRKSEEGVELTFAVNHLSAFRVANLLHDAVKNSPEPRVIIVSSHAHRSAKFHIEDVELENRRYSGWTQYCNSKLMNLLFMMELSRRWREDEIPVNALHPGVVDTGIARRWLLGRLLFRVFGTRPDKGADTLVYLATDPIGRKVTGEYFTNREPLSPRRMVFDEELQRKLWKTSEAYGV